MEDRLFQQLRYIETQKYVEYRRYAWSVGEN
jgi:hypothetical protein